MTVGPPFVDWRVVGTMSKLEWDSGLAATFRRDSTPSLKRSEAHDMGVGLSRTIGAFQWKAVQEKTRNLT